MEDDSRTQRNATSGHGGHTECRWARVCNTDTERRCIFHPVPSGAGGSYVVQSEDVCLRRDELVPCVAVGAACTIVLRAI